MNPPKFRADSNSSGGRTAPETSRAYTATDPERDAFTWSAGGSDGRLFTVDSSGYLSFNDPPDFEMPADANRDNEYLVTVEAQDIDRNTGTLEVTVSVINSTGAEEPTITTTGNPSPYREKRYRSRPYLPCPGPPGAASELVADWNGQPCL